MAQGGLVGQGVHLVGVWQGLGVQGKSCMQQGPCAGMVGAGQAIAPRPMDMHLAGAKHPPRAHKVVQGMWCGLVWWGMPAGCSSGSGSAGSPQVPAGHKGAGGTRGSSQVVPWQRGIPGPKGAHGHIGAGGTASGSCPAACSGYDRVCAVYGWPRA